MSGPLRLVVYTPQQRVLDQALRGVRVPTASGQLGLRAGVEPLVTVVEPGLIVLHAENGALAYLATSGGPLRTTGACCELYTAFAATGTDAEALLAALDRAVAAPDSELASRRRIEQLEQRILREATSRPERVRRSADG